MFIWSQTPDGRPQWVHRIMAGSPIRQDGHVDRVVPMMRRMLRIAPSLFKEPMDLKLLSARSIPAGEGVLIYGRVRDASA
jgi:hypothetical protein